MDTGTIVTTIIFLIIVILPFFLVGKKYKRQKRQLVKLLGSQAQQNQVKLSEHEVCGNFGIGMDENSQYLFFSRQWKNEFMVREVLLSEFSRCKMNINKRFLDEGENVTDRIELVFYPSTAGNPPVTLCLYDTENDNLSLSGELQAASKWVQIAEKVLKANKKQNVKPGPVQQAVMV